MKIMRFLLITVSILLTNYVNAGTPVSDFSKEKEKKGSGEAGIAREAKEIAIALGLPAREVATLMGPSDAHVRAVKDAIQYGKFDDKNIPQDLKAALERKKHLEIKDKIGYTPFLFAVYIDRPDMVEYLIDQGANMYARTKDGMNAFDLAKHMQNEAMQGLLFELVLRKAKTAGEIEAVLASDPNLLVFKGTSRENLLNTAIENLGWGPKFSEQERENIFKNIAELMIKQGENPAKLLEEIKYRWGRGGAAHFGQHNAYYYLNELLEQLIKNADAKKGNE